MQLIVPFFFAVVLACRAAENPAARWEGKIHVPGRELTLVVDLAQDGGGAWIGSIIVPGMTVSGAPLTDIVWKGSDVSFTSKDALASAEVGPATFRGKLTSKGTIAGEFKQAGHTAPFVLEKTGVAQVELPKRSTPLAPELAGEWKGKYELGGYPRGTSPSRLARNPAARPRWSS